MPITVRSLAAMLFNPARTGVFALCIDNDTSPVATGIGSGRLTLICQYLTN